MRHTSRPSLPTYESAGAVSMPVCLSVFDFIRECWVGRTGLSRIEALKLPKPRESGGGYLRLAIGSCDLRVALPRWYSRLAL